MRRTKVTFDGHELTALAIVSDLRRPLLPRRAEYVSVPGADGAIFGGAVDDTRKLTLTLTLRGHDPVERAEAQRALARILDVDSPRPLAISEDGGLWYMAMPNASSDGERRTGAESFDVEFTCDACMYGATEEVALSMSAGDSLGFRVGGTKPTPCVVDVSTTGSGAWRLTLDGQDAYSATLDGAAYLTIDSERRVATRDGNVYALPPTDYWFILAPGAHTLAVTGAGATGTLTYTERWA